MGGFLGSPWNFIFLEEFAAAGGARLSLSSLYEDTQKGHLSSLLPQYLQSLADSPFKCQEGGETKAQLGSNFLTTHAFVG